MAQEPYFSCLERPSQTWNQLCGLSCHRAKETHKDFATTSVETWGTVLGEPALFSGYSFILWVGGRVVTIALEVFEGELLYQWCPKSLVTLRKGNINFYSADPLTNGITLALGRDAAF